MTSRSVPERTQDEVRAAPGNNRISPLAAAPESAIRYISRLCSEHNGINLAQGYPDFACQLELKAAAASAITADANQYSMTWGSERFRNAIVRKTSHTYPGWTIDPLTEVCVTCGATEAMLATCLALLSAGDEVIVFEPFYED